MSKKENRASVSTHPQQSYIHTPQSKGSNVHIIPHRGETTPSKFLKAPALPKTDLKLTPTEPIIQNPIKPKPKKRKRRKKNAGCKCSKSKCLRLHCVCFRKGCFCNEKCGCKNCFNTEEKADLVKKVRVATKDINAEAFESRFVEARCEGQIIKLTRGCSCSKNNCQKNYCECFKNNLPCSPLCKCCACHNEQVRLEPEVVSQLIKKSSRKKKKIVFTDLGEDDIQVSQKVLNSKLKK